MSRLTPESRPAPRVRVWLLAASAIALLSLVLFADLPAWPRIWAVLNDAAHGPVFGILAVILLLLLASVSDRRGPVLFMVAFALAIVTGIGVEFVQGLIGRDSSWMDVGTDALGAACALGIIGWRGIPGLPSLRSRTGQGAALGIALLAAALLLAPIIEAAMAYARRAAEFPVIARFDSPLDLYFGHVQHAKSTRGPLPDQWARPGDGMSLRIESATGRWPGFVMDEPAPDWRGRHYLNLDVTNPEVESIQLTVRVHDVAHDQRHEDRFNRTVLLAPGRTTVTIPLADIASGPAHRALDLGQVAGIIVFADRTTLRSARRYYLTSIWLE